MAPGREEDEGEGKGQNEEGLNLLEVCVLLVS